MGATRRGAGPVKVEMDIAGRYLAAWAERQVQLREIVRRPYAVIDGRVRPLSEVVFHDPDAMRPR